MSKPHRPGPPPRGPRPPVVRTRPAEGGGTAPRSSPHPSERLTALFDAERAARRAHRELLQGDRAALLAALATATAGALRERDEREASVKLLCLAQVLGQCTGDQTVDLLIDILGSEVAEAQQASGDALTEMAFARFKEVALGIERALVRLPPESAARSELPFVLLEVGGAEPGGVAKLLDKMLQQQDAEAVEAAIEACAELGDASLVPSLERLAQDARRVELEDDAGETETVSIGQLASEACALLQGG